MSGKVVSAALLLAAVVGSPALGDLRGPAELPPPGYNGQQYVDSRGCVFLRAGHGGREAWVPRVTRDRKQLCGYPPSGRAVETSETPAPKPVAKAEPVPAPKPAPKSTPKPVAAAPKPAPAAAKAAPAVSPSKPASAPASGGVSAKKIVVVPADAIPAPPPGYKLAWEDDRLNPNRGKQTVQGVSDQDQIWTRTVPAELRAGSDVEERPLKVVVRLSEGSLTGRSEIVVSTKSEPKMVAEKPAPAKAARIFVQVGAFGVPANAEGTIGRLGALGLPMARGKAGALQVVYAGPFASAAEAKAALAAVRGAGFPDAVILR
ncbi:SPOR domain-containing protein [Pseudogemmobacter humi]|uniref:Sporulation related domain protein n=1 Tax=Pseudogemmobacter humi TaxID=2483812 RepID=A0A3P5X7F8_9RHOB|nr:SPOR domain-containing protein [Pseudogemmobacter humi]VDC30345.1 Sporulation related domain protein [Pseudogemmobacter humi]